MKLIAHRGNTSGRSKSSENTPDYIKKALEKGFDAEVDVWVTDGLYLGHDSPEHKCPMSFLISNSDKLWIHCKNLNALQTLSGIRSLNIFWHQEDDFTLTSKGIIWTYPKKPVASNSVIVSLELPEVLPDCYGICSDNLE